MMNKLSFSLLYLTLLLLFVKCTPSSSPDADQVKIEVNANDIIERLKYHDLDPFKDNIVESQFFEITGLKDEVIEGENGTVIIIPKGAFRNSKGGLVEDNIKIELAEAYSIQDMIQSNLTTTIKDKLAANGGIFYINATANGENLYIDKNNPIYVEMPKDEESKANVLKFEGVRSPDGEMHWIDKGPIEQFLMAVDINTLDFYPKGFEQAVESGMPFRGYTVADKKLKDSLFFSLKYDLSLAPMPGGGTWPPPTSDHGDSASVSYHGDNGGEHSSCNTVTPQSIAAIQHPKFEHSLLATREFEERLKVIYRSCDQELLDLYINNLDKNLWEIDQLAAQKVGQESSTYEGFIAFAEEKLTKVKNGAKYAEVLKNFYQKRLIKINQATQDAHQAYLTSLQKKEEKAQAKREEYIELLEERQKYRFSKFGFELDKMGWVMLATELEKLEKFTLEVKVPKAVELDRAHVYTFDPSINSLFALVANNGDKATFGSAYLTDWALIVEKGAYLNIIGVGYKGDEVYFAKTGATQKKVMQPELMLQKITKKELKKQLAKFDKVSARFNKLRVDLEYQRAFYVEQLRLRKLERETNFIYNLYQLVFSCCEDKELKEKGELLFKKNCSACHNPDMDADMTGPALAGVEARWLNYPNDLYRYIRNSQELVAEGQPRAVALFNEWDKSVMTSFPQLSDMDIKAILAYIRSK
ncbi:MAG: cytochrome c [Aureispira sp.]|nr:cytochrome c [Aureispira sp.]